MTDVTVEIDRPRRREVLDADPPTGSDDTVASSRDT
jgi:hypothetical protein